MLLMLICISFLSLESQKTFSEVVNNEPDTNTLDDDDDYPYYGFLAILMGCLAALFFAIRAVYVKLAGVSGSQFRYKLWDLSIDFLFCLYLIETLQFFVYYSLIDVYPEGSSFVDRMDWNMVWQGNLAGLCFMLGILLSQYAYSEGPGGPANALISTTMIYQTTLNAVFMD
jgi:hypothetical protein